MIKRRHTHRDILFFSGTGEMCAVNTDDVRVVSEAWKLLGVTRNATRTQLRRAYKVACLRYHPDKHPAGAERQAAERRFKQVGNLYDALLSTATDDTNYESERRSGSCVASCATGSTSSSSLPGQEVFSRPFGVGVSLEELVTGVSRRISIGNSGLTLEIRKGARPGDRLVTNGIEFVLLLRPHLYSVAGDDVIAMVDYSGETRVVYLRSLDGDMVSIRVPCEKEVVWNEGYVETIGERGLPRRTNPSRRGSLIVILRCCMEWNLEDGKCDMWSESREDAVIGMRRETMEAKSERLSRDGRGRRPSMWERSCGGGKERWRMMRHFRRPFSRW